MTTEDIADDADVIAKASDYDESSGNTDASGVNLGTLAEPTFKNAVYNALGSTIIRLVKSDDNGTDEVISDVAYDADTFTVSTSADSSPANPESFGEQLLKGYVNAMINRGEDAKTYSALVLHPTNVEALIRDTDANTYAPGNKDIDTLATDALYTAADSATWSDWNTAYLSVLQHEEDEDAVALRVENHQGADKQVFQNTKFYFKLNVTVNWNHHGDSTDHGLETLNAVQSGKELKVDDFGNLSELGVTLYKADDAEATGTEEVAYSKGSVLIKLNVDSDNLSNVD